MGMALLKLITGAVMSARQRNDRGRQTLAHGVGQPTTGGGGRQPCDAHEARQARVRRNDSVCGGATVVINCNVSHKHPRKSLGFVLLDVAEPGHDAGHPEIGDVHDRERVRVCAVPHVDGEYALQPDHPVHDPVKPANVR